MNFFFKTKKKKKKKKNMNYGILLHSQGRIFFLCDVLRGKTILTFVIPELMIKFQASIILRVFWHNLSIPFLLIVCNSFLERAYLST